MNTLLATNILLAIIVVAILAVAITKIIALSHLISITKKIESIVSEFQGDVIRARSVITAVVEKFTGKAKKKTTKKSK